MSEYHNLTAVNPILMQNKGKYISVYLEGKNKLKNFLANFAVRHL